MKLTIEQKEVMKSLKRDIKMIFFVRQDLKMGKGKIASQCSHGAISLYKKILKNDKNLLLDDWELTGSKKIVLKVKNENEFTNIIKFCELNNIIYNKVIDAGKTQIEKNSNTIINILHENKKIHNLIYKYKLL